MIWTAPSEEGTDNAVQRARLESPSPLGEERAGVRGEACSGDPFRELSIHGSEKTDETGRFDFVLANPPFNVNAMDTAMRVSARYHPEGTPQDLPERRDHERLKDSVGPGCRFPFGLPIPM